LYDVKVVHVSADTNGAAAARGAAVNSRARRVVGEYERHARRIDEHCAGTRAGDDGPVLRRLREVGVTGLAVGAFGEASDDARKLLGLVATTGAAERWRDAMAPSPLEKNRQKINPSPPKIETLKRAITGEEPIATLKGADEQKKLTQKVLWHQLKHPMNKKIRR
jgi:hypothetical protein